MSDMSSLSHEYASTTDFSQQMNHAVLRLKKRFLGAGVQPSEEDIASALFLVRSVVNGLIQRLDTELGDDIAGQPAQAIPEDVLCRIEERQRGNMEYFLDDLRRLETALNKDKALSRTELELLDAVCEVADASASATFRKLWRR